VTAEWNQPDIWYALAEIVDNPTPSSVLATELGLAPSREKFTQLFDFDLLPYGSYFLSVGPVLGGDPTARTREFIQSYLPDIKLPSFPDHLGFLLNIIGSALETRNTKLALAVFYEQVAPWAPLMALGVENYGPREYKAWGTHLRELCDTAMGAVRDVKRLPLHLQEAPEPERPETLDDLERYILSPVLSGLILPRSYILSLADEIGVPVRFGGRRFSFDSLMSQDPRAVLERIESLAKAQKSWGWPQNMGDICHWWHNRRLQAVKFIQELKRI
jgi:hypothetical protein